MLNPDVQPRLARILGYGLIAFGLLSCSSSVKKVDTLIHSGWVYTGENTPAQKLDVAICGEVICALVPSGSQTFDTKHSVDASNKVVSPGFIDPHTHSLEELQSQKHNSNLNYLTQGVTTVVNGNDGDGPVDIISLATALEQQGIGTNTALLVGHGTLRKQVMGLAARTASQAELDEMSQLLNRAMEQGALGLSSGLYYVPGNYADTAEVVALAKVAARYQGIYDTHLRDESTFNIGFIPALKEAIDIAQQAGIHLHLAHIKALGVDVWGQSRQAIDTIKQAQKQGVSISADQYPWQASGTFLRSALVPKWVMADSEEAMKTRFQDPALVEKIQQEIGENIRRRGGPQALLVTASQQPDYLGKNLTEMAALLNKPVVETVIEMVRLGRTRVASFNMDQQDIQAFMQQPWVVTSSDGTNGHPRKYASFPQKYVRYVKELKLMTEQAFIHRSSGKTAQVLGLNNRGFLKEQYQADVIIFDPKTYQPRADFSHWNRLSQGVENVFINGQQVIRNSEYQGQLAGQFVARGR